MNFNYLLANSRNMVYNIDIRIIHIFHAKEGVKRMLHTLFLH